MRQKGAQTVDMETLSPAAGGTVSVAAEDGSWGAAGSVTAVTVIWKSAFSRLKP